MENKLAKPIIAQGWLRAVAVIIPFVVVLLVFQAFGLWLLSIATGIEFINLASIIENNEGDLGYLIVLQFFSLMGTLFVLFIFRIFIDRKSFKSLGFQLDLQGLLFGVSLGLLIMGIGTLVIYAFDMLIIESTSFLFKPLIYGIVLCTIIALNEEIFTRGYLLQNLMESFGKYPSLIITAIIFSSMHIFNQNLSVLGIINLFLAGCLLGASYVHTKNLWFPIGLHFSWNFFQGPIFGFNVSGLNLDALIKQHVKESESIVSGGDFGFEGSIIASILMILAIILITLFYRKNPNISAVKGSE